jgi:hypothetical protein
MAQEKLGGVNQDLL